MGENFPTLLNIATTQDPDGSAAMVHEVLAQQNPMLKDAPSYPSNAKLANRVTLRSSLPTIEFAQINKGVNRSKGSYAQREDTIGFIRGLSEVDANMEDVEGEAEIRAFRWKEDQGFLEAMSQFYQAELLYGDEVEDAQSFTGLAPRLDSLSSDITGSIVLDMNAAPGGGDTSSIFVVDWGENGAHLIHPKKGSSVAGLIIDDKGEQRVTDADGKPFFALTTQFKWYMGLSVEDPRHIGRLANIDRSIANTTDPTQGLLVDKLDELMSLMPSTNGMQRVLYTHRSLLSSFRKQARDKASSLTMQEYLGELMPHFWGYPIRSVDQFVASEGTIT